MSNKMAVGDILMPKFMQWWLRTQKHTLIKFNLILISENNPLSTENIIKKNSQIKWHGTIWLGKYSKS